LGDFASGQNEKVQARLDAILTLPCSQFGAFCHDAPNLRA
jgi:hypothetical protein